jgi:predicted permease
MREIPGAESVGYSSHMPVSGGFSLATIPIRGSVMGKDDTYPTGLWIGVSPDFFPTMGIRIVEGRNFTAADSLPNARPVFIVDRKFAEKYFPGRSAIGEMFGFPPPGQKPEDGPVIVGVAEVAKLNGLEDSDGHPFIYGVANAGGGGFSIEVRTTRSLADMTTLMRAQLRSVDPTLPLYQVCRLQMNLDAAAANRRGVMWLLGAFAGIALLLSAVGIYGMLAYDVTQRTKEIGIRGAIGASRGQIIALILRQGLWRTSIGLVIGLVGALCLSRYMRSLLFEVPPTDPLSFAGVFSLLLGVALIASWVPARRAAKIDPVVALRAE